jgi:protein-disulfide isomerase
LTEKKLTEKQEQMNFNLPKNFSLIHLSVIIFICILGGALLSMFLMPSPVTNNDLIQVTEPTEAEITLKAVNYINENFLEEGVTIEAKGVQKTGDSLYLISFDLFEGTEKVQEGEIFITSDLKNMILGQVMDMSIQLPKIEPEEEIPIEVQKSEKPVIELFIMSHCPYGTQIEKGILPVYEALKDKADFQLKYVYYAMHGKTELDEQTLQRAIELQYGTEKLWDYLAEFLKDGDTERALTAVELSKEDLIDKINELDSQFNVTAEFENKENWLSGYYPLFNLDKEENEKYNVGGSPTLVLNGTSVQSARNPSALLETICNAFIEAPEECNIIQLSAANPSAGFGFEETASNTSATCG